MGQVTIDGIPVYQALVDSTDTGMLRISLVDDPAVQSNFLAFSNQVKAAAVPMMYAVQDEEKRLVLGVVMRADFPIYRRDRQADGSEYEYYIIYKADTIRTMAEKYLAENRQNLVNLDHQEGTEQKGIQMVQYFIKGKGISPEGFADIADGSLFAEFHVTNDEVWDAIKEGTYKGFSLEGIFDLTPERDKASVEEIVDALDGMFSKITKPLNNEKMSKVKGLLARLAEALAEEAAVEVKMGSVNTDKGIIAWEGEDDLKAGDAVFVEDENGNRSEAPDGEYTTGDGKVIIVAGGKVAEIKDAEAEVAPAEATAMVQTDKGKLSWDNEDEDLKAGDAVYVEDENGARVPAPDGEYTTEDGKVITVVDGKVASISDPKAEVSEEGRAEKMRRIAQAFGESYNEKFRKISEAIAAGGYENFWLVDAGDDFAVIAQWNEENYEEHYLRFKVSWSNGDAVVSDPVEVVPAFVTKEERDAADAAFKAVQAENAELKAQVETLKKQPATTPAHETFEAQNEVVKTGNKGLDNLARIARAK